LGPGGVAASDAMVGVVLLPMLLVLGSDASSSSTASPKLSRLLGVLVKVVRRAGVHVAVRWSLWSARLVFLECCSPCFRVNISIANGTVPCDSGQEG
jgi:hypothetical protein